MDYKPNVHDLQAEIQILTLTNLWKRIYRVTVLNRVKSFHSQKRVQLCFQVLSFFLKKSLTSVSADIATAVLSIRSGSLLISSQSGGP